MKKILIVESNRPIEGLSGSLFRRRECILEVASSGSEALGLAEKNRPDVVIYDGLVADFSPEEFVRALHSSQVTDDVRVVVMLHEGEEKREGPILRAGASAVLFQPTSEVDLNAKVCEVLGISLRRHLRTFVKMKVDTTVGATTHFATISNISLGGVLIETDKAIRKGEIIKLSFFLPGDDDPIQAIARIVRALTSGENKAYGCQFLDLSDSAKLRIHEFVTAGDGDDPG